MTVRAKFKVTRLTQDMSSHKVEMEPVASGSDENKSFFKYTPSGSIVLSTVNPEAAKQFAIGAEFYVDFTEAT